MTDQLLTNCDKEIRMWRERFLEHAYISHKKEEREFVKRRITYSAAGIGNIDDYIHELIKDYRELNK